MLRRTVLHLLAPDSSGGAAVADPDVGGELPPDGGLGNFMDGIREMAGDVSGNTPPKQDDGPPTEKPAGNAGAAKPGDPNAAATAQPAAAKPAADAHPDGKQPAAAAAKPAADTDKAGADDDKWPRSNKDWEKLKTARKEEREKLQADIKARDAQLAEISAKLKEVETKATITPEAAPESKAEVERLNKLVEDMSNRIRVLDVTQEPRFETYFKNQINDQIAVAKEILGDERAKAYENLMGIPNHPATAEWKKEQIESFIADLSPLEAATIANVNVQLGNIERARKNEIAKNQEHVNTLKAKQEEKVKMSVAAGEKIFAETVASLGDDKVGIAVFQKKSGDEEWNRGVDGRIADAKRILFGGQGLKGQDVAKAALHAAAYPFLLQTYAADRAEWQGKLTKLEAQVKELSAAGPSQSRGTNTGAPTVDSPAPNRGRVGDTHMDPSSAVAEWMKSTIPSLD